MRSLSITLVLCLSHLLLINYVHGLAKLAKTDQLEDYLESRASANVIPGAVSVKIRLSLQDLDYNPSTELATVSVWETYVWTDERLQWSPSQYGVSTLHLPEQSVWTPDIVLYNGYGDSYKRTHDVNAVITSDGQTHVSYPSSFQVRCPKSGSSVVCQLKFGSWTYSNNYISLTSENEDVKLYSYTPNKKVDQLETSVRINVKNYEGVDDAFPDFTATLKFNYNGREFLF